MLLKQKLSAFLLTIGLLASPAALSVAVLSGEWEDGTTLQWVCPDKKEFNLPFQFNLPDGTFYRGVILCGRVT